LLVGEVFRLRFRFGLRFGIDDDNAGCLEKHVEFHGITSFIPTIDISRHQARSGI
jgi:hypothetical protein